MHSSTRILLHPSPLWLRLTRRAAVVFCLLAVAACGGGGGGDEMPTETPPAPTPTSLVAPAAQTRQLDHTATASALAGSFDIRFTGNRTLTWVASTNQDWLVLSTAAGSGAGTLAYTVDTSKLADLPNWGSAVANVSISANGASVMTTLTLDKRLPEITMVSPNAIAAGQTGTVRVLGRGLSRLSGVGAIQVGSVTGLTGTVVSDSEATLNLPALAQGRYAISVSNALGMESTTASLAAATALAPATVNRRDEKASTVFDASRNAAYMTASYYGYLSRVRFDGTQWLQDSIELPPENGVRGIPSLMQMAPDGRTLYVATRRNLVAVDPDTLAIQASYPLPTAWQGVYGSTVRNLAITHDLRLWFTPTATQSNTTAETNLLAYFDLRTKRFETAYASPDFVFPAAPPYMLLRAGLVIGASGDGTRLIGIHKEPGMANFIYDAASSSFTPIPALSTARTLTAVSEDGSTVVLDSDSIFTVQTSGLQPHGVIPPTPGQATFASALSSDKTRLYAIVGAPPQPTELGLPPVTPQRVAVFDARAPGAGPYLPQLGSVALPASLAGCDLTFQAFVRCTPGGILQVSPLGDSLHWFYYYDGLTVLPLPAALRPLSAAGG